MRILDGALVLGATARLTRLVITDDLGLWLIKKPVVEWASRRHPLPVIREGVTELRGWEPNWRDKLVSGIDCPFCVGFWIGAGVLGGTMVTRPATRLGRVWRFVLAALSLNYVAAHTGARLGDVMPYEDQIEQAEVYEGD